METAAASDVPSADTFFDMEIMRSITIVGIVLFAATISPNLCRADQIAVNSLGEYLTTIANCAAARMISSGEVGRLRTEPDLRSRGKFAGMHGGIDFGRLLAEDFQEPAPIDLLDRRPRRLAAVDRVHAGPVARLPVGEDRVRNEQLVPFQFSICGGQMNIGQVPACGFFQ